MLKTGSKTGRLFFAIVPAREQQLQLVQLAKSIRLASGEKITATDRMHMTLRYIGPVEHSILQCLIDKARQLQASAFTLRLNITDYWKKPRVTWVGTDRLDENLKQLVNALEKMCQACGVVADTSPYIPHITLLRKSIRHAAGLLPKEIVCPVEKFVLIESISIPGGVEYHKVDDWLLS